VEGFQQGRGVLQLMRWIPLIVGVATFHDTWYCSFFDLPKSRDTRTPSISHSGSPLIASGGSGSAVFERGRHVEGKLWR
jgi:hypothetical protein